MNNNMRVSKSVLLKNSDNVITFTKEEFEAFKKKLSVLPSKKGASSSVYFDDNWAYKIYEKEPILTDQNYFLMFNGSNVVENLFMLKDIKNDKSSSPETIYVCEDNLVSYKAKRVRDLDNISDINKSTDEVSLENLKNAWNEAYNLAQFYADKGIVMYDAFENNCFMKNGRFMICDLDFFRHEAFTQNISLLNNEIINTMFINFIEAYLKDENYGCRYDKYLIGTNRYVDEVIEDLLLASSYGCKTLKEVSLNL